MSPSANHGRLRLGRMAKWQRWASYSLFASCVTTGLIWFVLSDLFEWMPPQLKVWWVLHGVTSILSLLLIGAALPQHISVTWKAKRNRIGGGVSTFFLGLLLGSVIALYYGAGSFHDEFRLVHIALGICLVILFPWHILRGRKSRAVITRMKNT
jgi:hypothetical protein